VVVTVRRRLLATAARFGLAAILLATFSIAHCDENAFSKWAAAHAVPLTTIEPSEDFSDLLPLKSAIGSARVVALGEPTHGAHEPLAFRNRLIRFLVEQMGFTAIALETGFTESAFADTFVGGGPGDVQSAIRTGAINRYAENAELIQWLRDRNAAAAAAGHRRVRLYGAYITGGARVCGPRRVLDYSLNYIARADPAEADRIRLALRDSLPPLDKLDFGVLSQPALAALDVAILQIAEAMAKNRSSLTARSSPEEYRWALHNLEVARQVSRTFHLTTPQFFEDMKVGGPVMAAADLSMAENVRWIVENEGPKGRVLVFAHNGHVMNWMMDGGYWAPMLEKPPAMGWHLRRAFGKNLVIVVTSSATGSTTLGKWQPVEGSIDDILAQLGPRKLFLDSRAARQDEAAHAWLSTTRPLRANIDTFELITPSTAVDVLVYLGGLTPAILSSDMAP
jgi:erythromycin esterase